MKLFPTFDDWYKDNKKKALSTIEKQFDLSAIPTRRSNKVTLFYNTEMKEVYGSKICMEGEHYIPSLLVLLRERNHLEVVELHTTCKDAISQIESINKKLSPSEQFNVKIVLA